MRNNKVVIFAVASTLVVGSGFAFMLLTKANSFTLTKATDKSITFNKGLVTGETYGSYFQNNGGTYSHSQPLQLTLPYAGTSGIDMKVYARGKVVSDPANVPATNAQRTDTGFCFGNQNHFVTTYADQIYDAQLTLEIGLNNLTMVDIAYSLGDGISGDTTSTEVTRTITVYDENGDMIEEPVTETDELHGLPFRIGWFNFTESIVHKVVITLEGNNFVSPNAPLSIDEVAFNWSC